MGEIPASDRPGKLVLTGKCGTSLIDPRIVPARQGRTDVEKKSKWVRSPYRVRGRMKKAGKI